MREVDAITKNCIGERLRRRRKALGISAVDIAARAGLSKATIHRYESGDIKSIKLPTVELLAETLQVNPLWLIGKSDRMERENPTETDVGVMVDELIRRVRDSTYLTMNGAKLTAEGRRVLLTCLKLARSSLDDMTK